MNWINLSTSVLDSAEFLGSAPVERATWLCLLRYCAGQENGGRISGCKPWKDRQWQQLVRITLKEVTLQSDLWKWENDDLVVAFYCSDKEQEVQQRRERAKTNGRSGGRPRNTNDGTQKEPTLVNFAKAEEKRREEKRKEGEECTPPTLIECQNYAATLMPKNPAFAESVGRQFHSVFDPDWTTKSGKNLLERGQWKQRLKVMLEEEARRNPAKAGNAPVISPRPAPRIRSFEPTDPFTERCRVLDD